MTWTDDEVTALMALGSLISDQQTVKQKNLKHWTKGYSMGLSVLMSLFTFDEFMERWEKVNAS